MREQHSVSVFDELLTIADLRNVADVHFIRVYIYKGKAGGFHASKRYHVPVLAKQVAQNLGTIHLAPICFLIPTYLPFPPGPLFFDFIPVT